MNYMTKLVLLSIVIMSVTLATDDNWSGVVFYEYSISGDNEDTGEFEVNRTYLTYSRKLADNLKIKVQTDVGRQKNDPSNPHLFLYLKNARLDWKTEFGTIIMGLQGMNMFAVQEKNWGYRYIEKSTMDRNKWSSSADMGLGYATEFGSSLSLNAMITNGSGYKKPENDPYKKISFQVFTGEKKLSGESAFNFGGVFSYEPYDVDSVTVGSTLIAGGFGGWKQGMLKVGGEYNLLIDSDASANESLISAYGTAKIVDKLSVFGRMDILNDGSETENYMIAGVRLKPVSGLDIAPNVRFANDDSSALLAVNFQFKF